MKKLTTMIAVFVMSLTKVVSADVLSPDLKQSLIAELKLRGMSDTETQTNITKLEKILSDAKTDLPVAIKYMQEVINPSLKAAAKEVAEATEMQSQIKTKYTRISSAAETEMRIDAHARLIVAQVHLEALQSIYKEIAKKNASAIISAIYPNLGEDEDKKSSKGSQSSSSAESKKAKSEESVAAPKDQFKK